MMNAPDDAVAVWEGTATYNGATYRVTVIAPEGSWKADLIKAVNKAKGYNVHLEQGTLARDDRFKLSTMSSVYRVGYTITFTPDHCLTANAGSRSQKQVLLRKDLSIISDGEFQKAVRGYGLRNSSNQGRIATPMRFRP